MSRYTGPAYKKSRRVGFSTLGTGEELVKRPYGPGIHGADRKSKLSNYGLQLNEKQKIRFTYGISEKQLKKVFEKAGKLTGIHGENILKLLEARLDNVVYRMGIASTRRAARQIVNHGHIEVNGKKVDIPSYQVKPGDVVAVRENSREHKAIKAQLEKKTKLVDYVSFDNNKFSGVFVRYPERNELSSDINESLVVEYYNK